MNMVERVARALAARMVAADNVSWEHCVDDARAAIAAMRVPTETMTEAGCVAGYEQSAGIKVSRPFTLKVNPIYSAMIDAALSEPPK